MHSIYFDVLLVSFLLDTSSYTASDTDINESLSTVLTTGLHSTKIPKTTLAPLWPITGFKEDSPAQPRVTQSTAVINALNAFSLFFSTSSDIDWPFPSDRSEHKFCCSWIHHADPIYFVISKFLSFLSNLLFWQPNVMLRFFSPQCRLSLSD